MASPRRTASRTEVNGAPAAISPAVPSLFEGEQSSQLAVNAEFDAWGTGNARKMSSDSTRIGTVYKLALPQHETTAGIRFRKKELEERRSQYVWDFTFNGGKSFPIPVGIPQCELTGVAHTVDAISHTFAIGTYAICDAAKQTLSNWGGRKSHVDFMKSLYREGEMPPNLADDAYLTDEEFGRQRVQGLYPKMIRKLLRNDPVLAKFPVAKNRAYFTDVLPASTTFDQLIDQGVLYYIDYELLDGIKAPVKKNLTAPIALFWDDRENKRLLPLAIQLGQVPSDKCPIFTCRDPKNVWQVAKIHFQVAEVQYHGVLGHLFHTHWCMESTYTAMRRCLSSRHPVHELLFPHFWFTIIIEFAARHFLIAEPNVLPQLLAMGFEGQNDIMARGWERFDFNNLLNVNKEVGARQAEGLSSYPYYEDGKRVWTAVEKYVTALVDNFYAEAGSIAADAELQAWYYELTSKEYIAFKNLPDFSQTGNAAHASNKANLTEFLSCVLYNVSGGHASVNNSQWDYLSPLNMPGWYNMAPPTSKTQPISETDIANAFPGFKDCVIQMGMFRGLTTATNRPLGWYQEGFFAGRPEVIPIVAQFRADLAKVSAEIKKDNETKRKGNPYRFMDPEQIAMGIAI